MDESAGARSDAVIEALAREEELIQSAIAMVACGGASRLSLSALRFAGALWRAADQMARAAGVRVEPVWTVDEAAIGLSIESSTDG